MSKSILGRVSVCASNSQTTLDGAGQTPTPQDALSSCLDIPREKGMSSCSGMPFSLNPTGAGADLKPSDPRKVADNLLYYLDPTANLVDLASQIALPVTPCQPKWTVVECDCGRRVVKTGCMSSRCPACYEQVKNRRGKSVFDRFHLPFRNEQGFKQTPTVCQTVLTIPLNLRYKYFDFNEWQKVRKQAWKMLKETFGAVYALEASHPIGDEKEPAGKDPITGAVIFHPHLNFLWMPRKRGQCFISVSLLNQKWAEILGVPVVDVYHQYTDNREELLHWCLYVCRPFPAYWQWKGAIRWYGQYPKMPSKVIWLCPACGMPIKAIGTIADYMVRDYDEQAFESGLEPPWMYEDNIDRFKNKREVLI